MATSENNLNNNYEDKISDALERTSFEEQSVNSNDENALTLRALVSTKEAGVIIGKGKRKKRLFRNSF
jgi:heterogeneous nuclear rnp K-like protein 2